MLMRKKMDKKEALMYGFSINLITRLNVCFALALVLQEALEGVLSVSCRTIDTFWAYNNRLPWKYSLRWDQSCLPLLVKDGEPEPADAKEAEEPESSSVWTFPLDVDDQQWREGKSNLLG